MNKFVLAGLLAFLSSAAFGQTPTAIGGTSLSSGGLGTLVTTAATSQTVLSRPGNVYSLGVTTGATGGFVLGFDALTIPADGAVTPKVCFVAPASSTTSFTYSPGPALRLVTGFVMSFSTGADCVTMAKAASFLWSQAQ